MEYCPYCMCPLEQDGPCPDCGRDRDSYVPAPHHLPVGTVLRDRYLLGGVLGEGGFGITYIGMDLDLEKRVAVKEYFPAKGAVRLPGGPDVAGFSGTIGELYSTGRERFLREARIMARLDREPCIVGVRDYLEANNTAYIVMDYVDGISLRHLMEQRGGRIPASELLPLTEPLFGALEEMHQKGLIHRDINPDNLMLERGELRLLDFGCARESVESALTVTVTVHHGFAPMEQYQPDLEGQGPWTDVYALSATLYQCLTGLRPPPALDRLMKDSLVPPRQAGADITPEQEAALLRGMALHPMRRYRTVGELHDALFAAPAKAAPKRARRIGKWAAVLAAGAAAVLLAVLAVTVPKAPEDPFADAFRLGDADPVSGETPDFPALLADDSVRAVVVPAGTVAFYLNGETLPLPIDKPVLLEPGAELYFEQSALVTAPLRISEGAKVNRGGITVGEGGRLELEGSLSGGFLRTVDGGCVELGPESNLYVSLLWLEREEDLSLRGLERDPTLDMPFRITADGRGPFADAARVSDFRALAEAAEAGTAGAVVVDGSFSVERDLSLACPLLISEGSVLTVPEGVSLRCGATVVNRGGVDGTLELEGQAALLNLGSARAGAPEGTRSGARIWNLGTLEMCPGLYRKCVLVNEGGLRFLPGGPEDSADLAGGVVINYGKLELRSGSRVRLLGDIFFTNEQKMLLHPEAELVNRSTDLLSYANLTVYGALDNTAGVLKIGAGALELEEGGRISGGVLVLDENAGASMEAGADALSCTVVRFPCQSPDRSTAWDRETFNAALADGSGAAIHITGPVETGDLTLTREIVIEDGGSLQAGSMTVEGVPVRIHKGGSLSADTLVLREGAHLSNEGAVRVAGEDGLTLEAASAELAGATLLEARRVTLRGGSHMFLGARLPDSDVTVEGGSALIVTIDTALSRLQVTDGFFSASYPVTLGDTRIGPSGIVVLSGGGELVAGCEASNSGLLLLDNCSWRVAEGAALVNSGEMVLAGAAGDELTMEGDLRNSGTLTIHGTLANSGAVENSGSVYADGGAVQDRGGLWSGDPPLPAR